MSDQELRSKAFDRLMNLRRAEFYLRQMEFRKLAAGDYGAMTTAALRAAERVVLERSRELRVRGSVAVVPAAPGFLAGAEEGLREITHEALIRADYKAVDALIPALVRVADDQAERESLEENARTGTNGWDNTDDPDDEEDLPSPVKPPVVAPEELEEGDIDPQGIGGADMDHQEIHDDGGPQVELDQEPRPVHLPPPPPAPAVAHGQPEVRTPVGPGSVTRLIRSAPPPTR